jgi:hypothetical protein
MMAVVDNYYSHYGVDPSRHAGPNYLKIWPAFGRSGKQQWRRRKRTRMDVAMRVEPGTQYLILLNKYHQFHLSGMSQRL